MCVQQQQNQSVGITPADYILAGAECVERIAAQLQDAAEKYSGEQLRAVVRDLITEQQYAALQVRLGLRHLGE